MQENPEHMDKWTRNERLQETLEKMGLFVVPVRERKTNRIEYFHVSAGVIDYQHCQG